MSACRHPAAALRIDSKTEYRGHLSPIDRVTLGR